MIFYCFYCFAVVDPPTNVNVYGSGDGSGRDLYKTGQTAILRCRSSSATPVSYRWTFSNGRLPSNAISQNAVLE